MTADIDPGQLAATLKARGIACARLGRPDQAGICFEGALRLAPDDPALHLLMGELLQDRGRPDQARFEFERALALDPGSTAALVRLGVLHGQVDRPGPAARCYRWALALDPGLQVANYNLSILLENEARLQEAQLYRDRAARPQPLVIETAPRPRRRVLIPWAAGTGNLPIENLLPRETTTRIRWIVECATDAQEAELPPCDLVFNAIGNADLAGPAYARLVRFQQRRPMLNRPECVTPTRRDLLPGHLAGIPDLVVPRTLRLRRDEAMDPRVAARLEAEGLAFPLIVRPISTQGGKGARRVDNLEQWAEATGTDADAFYAIAYHDYRAPDGQFRKYRVIFVDRKPYPYHLAISVNWLVHYYSAGMREEAWKREEEGRFLLDPAGTLGARAWAALEAIGRRLDLDYAGIDFTLQPDGRLLLFEANATMLVHLREPMADFPAKHAVVPAIFEAFEALLRRAEGRPR